MAGRGLFHCEIPLGMLGMGQLPVCGAPPRESFAELQPTPQTGRASLIWVDRRHRACAYCHLHIACGASLLKEQKGGRWYLHPALFSG